MTMQHFRHIRQSVALLTLRGQNISICSPLYAETLKMCLLQTSKNSPTNLNHQSHTFRLAKCGFHTSQRRQIHPLIWVIAKPVAKISAALTGRGVRKWYKGLGPKERKEVWTAVKERWYLFAGACGALLSLFIGYYLSHIEETPITGRKRFMALTHDQILSVAKSQADALIEAYNDKMFMADSVQARRVMDAAKRLLMANPELQKMSFDKWEVYVVNDPLVNACVLPNGHIFVFDGMLQAAINQDELAIILGHEMAHALLEHGIEELSYGQFIDYIVIVIMAALWCVVPNDGIAIITQWFHNKMVNILTHLPHSRTLEEEADRVGAMLASKACYDVRHGVVLWKKMEAAQKITSDASLPAFLSTHPHNLKRADFFDFITTQAEKWRSEGKCPDLSKTDPRKAIQIISKLADEQIAIRKTGQNLRRVHMADITGAKAATSSDIHISKLTGVKGEDLVVCEQEIKRNIESIENKSVVENVVEENDARKAETESGHVIESKSQVAHTS